ncbi:heterokaryon incompatibility protein-domain-containing protein [Nemania sp. FL0916]|nr:heterokaryon incompatibility protein-domain-containing protein [Nemania sp. FL0916]
MHSKAHCPICERVNVVLTGGSDAVPQDTESGWCIAGTFAEIRQNRDCDVCQFVAEKLKDDQAKDAYEDQCAVRFWRWDAPDTSYLYSFGPVESDINCDTCDLDHHILTLVDLELADLNPDWIDLDRVRTWAKACDAGHAGTCHRLAEWASTPLPSLAPLLLVDVNAECLEEVPSDRLRDIQYIALSYVWGQLHGILETTMVNEHSLRQRRALASPPYLSHLPDTVRDAIELVKRLGIPYLWVDRLCIVQDDLDRKLPQLEQMGAIYANAYMTLVAADGADANHGLRGSCPGVANPRVRASPLLSFSPAGKSLVVEPNFAPRTGPGQWHRRGWTFQERTLSIRNLIFQDGRVFWECRGAVWTEELVYGPSPQPVPGSDKHVLEQNTDASQPIPRNQHVKPSAYNITLNRWPDLHAYEILVRAYSELLLSFPSDGLRAFTGIVHALSRSFPGGLLYGIPEYFFDYALLWAPYTPVHRRLVNGKLDPEFPSWSWVGWTGGGVNLSIAPVMHQSSGLSRAIVPWDKVELHPKIRWSKIDTGNGTCQAVSNGYYVAAKMRKDNLMTLPEGWSRVVTTRNGDAIEGFVHKDLPEHIFLWPLQISDSPLGRPAGSFQSQLHTRTSRAFLFLGTRLQPEWEEKVWSISANAVVPRASTFHLLDSHGGWAGILQSTGAEESPAISREIHECIVISGGLAWKDGDDELTSLQEYAQVDAIKSLPIYEFYNVLSIEWESGIAYRKAVGRVWKKVWERLDASDIDMILG